ncbi:MAG: class I SAM-dependent methyltransferase [Campylobacter sp.]
MILNSNYDEIDFNELYKAQRRKSSFAPKTKLDWDKKAIKFNQTALTSQYADDFLSRVDFRGVKTVLDFACGAGALSLKAAKIVDQVFAYDYSTKMLDFLQSHIKEQEISNITVSQKAFEEDWSDVEKCDIVFASRCLEVDDPRTIIAKLLSKTKKCLYLTYKVEKSFVDDEILCVLGRSVVPKPNYLYILNIIAQMGYEPRLDFINASSCHIVTDEEELIKKITWELTSEMNLAEKQRLIKYYKNGGKAFAKPMKWAFISVDKEK